MGATLVSLFGRRAGWTNAERAQFARIESLLEQAGFPVEVEHGQTDEGDPWCVFCSRLTGEVIVHAACIDGRIMIDSPVLPRPIEGVSFEKCAERFFSDASLPVPPGQRRDQVMVHPAALLASLFLTIVLYAHATSDQPLFDEEPLDVDLEGTVPAAVALGLKLRAIAQQLADFAASTETHQVKQQGHVGQAMAAIPAGMALAAMAIAQELAIIDNAVAEDRAAGLASLAQKSEDATATEAQVAHGPAVSDAEATDEGQLAEAERQDGDEAVEAVEIVSAPEVTAVELAMLLAEIAPLGADPAITAPLILGPGEAIDAHLLAGGTGELALAASGERDAATGAFGGDEIGGQAPPTAEVFGLSPDAVLSRNAMALTFDEDETVTIQVVRLSDDGFDAFLQSFAAMFDVAGIVETDGQMVIAGLEEAAPSQAGDDQIVSVPVVVEEPGDRSGATAPGGGEDGGSEIAAGAVTDPAIAASAVFHAPAPAATVAETPQEPLSETPSAHEDAPSEVATLDPAPAEPVPSMVIAPDVPMDIAGPITSEEDRFDFVPGDPDMSAPRPTIVAEPAALPLHQDLVQGPPPPPPGPDLVSLDDLQELITAFARAAGDMTMFESSSGDGALFSDNDLHGPGIRGAQTGAKDYRLSEGGAVDLNGDTIAFDAGATLKFMAPVWTMDEFEGLLV